MAVNLSPVGGVAGQFFDNNGDPLVGGKLFTYAAGTTTPQVTYTSSSGGTPNSNPIILNAGGRVPSEIWLTDGLAYKFVLYSSTDQLIGSWDNIIGINSNFVNFVTSEEVQIATAGQTVFTLTTMSYQPGLNNLVVYVDGVNQVEGGSYSFVETNSTTVTFTAGLHLGAVVKFVSAETLTTVGSNANVIAYEPAGAGAVVTTVQAKLRETVSVKDFGAVGDGVTDDSASFQDAFDYCIANNRNLYIPSGHYICSITIGTVFQNTIKVYGEANVQSQISKGTVLEAVNPGGYVFTLNASGFIFEDLTFEGASKTKNGITTATEFAGYIAFYNVKIWRCNIGVYRPLGNYGWMYYNCNIVLNNYGIYAHNTPGVVMQAGLDRVKNSDIRQNSIVGYYIDDEQSGTNGPVIEDCIIESNGWGIYIRNYRAIGTFTISRCWYENNANGASITVQHFKDGTSTTSNAYDVFVRNTRALNIKTTYGQGKIVAESSVVITNNAPLTVVSSTNSSFISEGNGVMDQSTDVDTLYLAPAKNYRSDRWTAFQAPHRTVVKQGNSGSLINKFSDINLPYGLTAGTHQPDDGVATKGCLSLTFSSSAGVRICNTAGQDTSRPWKLHTIAVKNPDADVFVNFTFDTANGFFTVPQSNEWRTFVLLTEKPTDGLSVSTFISCSAATGTAYFADLQFLEFESYQDLVSFLQSGIYVSATEPFIGFATAIPLTGTWKQGDRLFNASAAIGSPKSWVCTVGGTPGTWVSEGNL
jgi:hypothetical protein